MSDKLQNIKAVNQLLQGNHKSQTRKSVYTGKTTKEILEEDILERSVDGKPKVWIETSPSGVRNRVTQHDGFKSKQPDNSILKSIQDVLNVPEECPKCDCKMRGAEKRLNFKFWFKRKMCFSCVLKEEHVIRTKGKSDWQQYQNKIMSANAEAWFTDTDKEVEILKQSVTETVWGNADGERGEVDISSTIQRIDTDYIQLKQKIRKQLTETTNGNEPIIK
jgi:hypothetical protein